MSDTEATVLIVVVWFLVATVVALLARDRGKSGLTWFGLSVLLSPVLAGIVLLLTVPRSPR